MAANDIKTTQQKVVVPKAFSPFMASCADRIPWLFAFLHGRNSISHGHTPDTATFSSANAQKF
jgi:hypothetical protein